MTDRWKNILIGSFVVGAFALGVLLVFFLKPTIGDGKKSIQVRFANISGIHRGTRVTYAGKPVGEVIKIRQLPNARNEVVDETGRVFAYELTLCYDSSAQIFTTDEIAIRTTGLMGEKSIAILPKATTDQTKLAINTILYANPIDPIESTITRIGKVAGKAEESIHSFDRWFQQNGPILSQATASIGKVADSAHALLEVVDQTSLIPTLQNSLTLLNENLTSIQTAFYDDELLSKLSFLITDLSETASIFNSDGARILTHLDRITNDLASGTGTLGRFLVNDDFYLRINSLMSKSETLMNDVNHYGLLFQYNKCWQRSRTKKATLLQALDSPSDFKNYFEGEVDSINTSLGRINELMLRAEEDLEREKIVQSDAFRRDFAHLLRQVQGLSDTLKLYNEDLCSKSNDYK